MNMKGKEKEERKTINHMKIGSIDTDYRTIDHKCASWFFWNASAGHRWGCLFFGQARWNFNVVRDV